jgi:two-component sensor histidine kinase
MRLSDENHSLWEAPRLKRALHAAGVALWSWTVETDVFAMDEQGFELWGLPQTSTVTFEELSSRIHPADRDRVRAAFTATRAIVGAYEIDFRILLGEEIRWVSARGLGNDEGLHKGQMSGVFLDVTGRKQAEEGHELLAGEMSHRVKNLLAIAEGLTNLTSRSSTTVEDMAKELTGRLTALRRAHDFVRPLPGDQGRAALLGDLIAVLLAPYDDSGAFSGRIRVAVPRMGIGEQSATALALVIHELATNSVKYGALSVGAGLLDISGLATHDEVCIVWTERGGPPVEPPNGQGYGSKLLNRSVTGQLGGSIKTDWSAEGIIVTVNVNAQRLST